MAENDLEVPHRRPNQRNEKADHEGADVRAGRHFVVLLGDREDPKDQKGGQYDFVAEGVQGNNTDSRDG